MLAPGEWRRSTIQHDTNQADVNPAAAVVHIIINTEYNLRCYCTGCGSGPGIHCRILCGWSDSYIVCWVSGGTRARRRSHDLSPGGRGIISVVMNWRGRWPSGRRKGHPWEWSAGLTPRLLLKNRTLTESPFGFQVCATWWSTLIYCKCHSKFHKQDFTFYSNWEEWCGIGVWFNDRGTGRFKRVVCGKGSSGLPEEWCFEESAPSLCMRMYCLFYHICRQPPGQKVAHRSHIKNCVWYCVVVYVF